MNQDTDGDGLVTIKEAADWWDRKQNKMKDTLFADPTKKWGDSPATTSREVGWFIARRSETNKIRRAHQAKWRHPKESCAETLYAQEYVKFAGRTPFSRKDTNAPNK